MPLTMPASTSRGALRRSKAKYRRISGRPKETRIRITSSPSPRTIGAYAPRTLKHKAPAKFAGALSLCSVGSRSSRRARWPTGGITAAALSEVAMGGLTHSVEFRCLVGIQQPLDLCVRAVADDPRQHRDGIELGFYGLVQRYDLAMLLLDQ